MIPVRSLSTSSTSRSNSLKNLFVILGQIPQHGWITKKRLDRPTDHGQGEHVGTISPFNDAQLLQKSLGALLDEATRIG